MKTQKVIHKRNLNWLLLSVFILLSFACNFPLLRKPDKYPVNTVMPVTPTPAINTDLTPSAGELDTLAEAQSLIPMEIYQVNDLMPYTSQAGDTLAALAERFRTTVDDIMSENPSLAPAGEVSTLAAGQKFSIRLTVQPFWDEGVMILPNSLYVNGPAAADFDTSAYLSATRGWLKDYVDRTGETPVSGLQIVQSIADNYSISPRLILTVLEYKLHALTDPNIPASFSLGNFEPERKTLGRQLSWAANTLNNGYYGWRRGALTQFASLSGYVVTPNPWQNAATVAIQYYLSRFEVQNDYRDATLQNGFLQTYMILFAPFQWDTDLERTQIPENLRQPEMRLPFKSGLRWAFTAGPHSGWGSGFPWAAIDFAPPSEVSGCDPSEHWAVAMADGVITRSEDGLVVQDLDGDGDSRTGWVILYLHIFPDGAPAVGDMLEIGDRIGHPSCKGGQSTGRNLHIARLYNGEWIPAGSAVPLDMDGWVIEEGSLEYKGALSRKVQTVYPSNIGVWSSQIMADPE